MNQPVKVAVVGASGGMGKLRVNQLLGEDRCQVTAACARNLDQLREAVPEPAVRLVDKAEEVYAADDVEAVVICVPNALHYQHIKAALQAGKHVHCEYPLTDDLGRYDELVALAQEQGLVLHHALTTRAESLHLTMKDALAGLGEPRAAYYRYYGGGGWYINPALRGDLFCALHIHFIDQFVDFFGQPQALVAHGVEKDGQASAVVMMQYPEGLVGTIEFAMGFDDRPAYSGTVVTTDGWCGFTYESGVLTVTVGEGGETGALIPPPDTSKEEDISSFLDELLGTGGPQSDLATGRNAIALCLECSRQLQS